MAAADRETIQALLTDTVTLLCRNSLPFSKLLKVQGLLGITVDETDVYIIQIDEEYGDSGPSESVGHAAPMMTRAPVSHVPLKRPRTSAAARTPVCHMAQTVPRRMRGGMTTVSSGSALARQKVRQQLNFPSPQKGMHMPNSAAASPLVAKQMFAMRSPQSAARLSAPVTPTQTPPMRFQRSPRMPLSLQKPRKMLMLEEAKKLPTDPSTPARRTPGKPFPKMEKVEQFSAFCQQPVKTERAQRDIICVESDEENSDTKKMPDLVPFSTGVQSAMQDMVEDDKTRALQAIMNQALNEARAVSSSYADSYQGDNYKGDGGFVGSYSMDSESVVKKMEPVSSSQLSESDMGFDPGEIRSAQFPDDFSGGPDMKPFFDQNPMQMSWDLPQAISSPSWNLPPTQPLTPVRSSAQPVGSPWIKTENTPVSQKMSGNVVRTKGATVRSPQPIGAAYSSPQQLQSPGIPSGPASIGSIQQQQDASSGSWKSVTTTKFICSINSCEKEFTTKRAMRHHQKTLHGAMMGGGGGGGQRITDSPGDDAAFQYDSSDMWHMSGEDIV